MKLIDLANKLIPAEIPVHEISLTILSQEKRLPAPAFWPKPNDIYKAGIMVPELKLEDSINTIQESVPDDPCIITTIENLLKENKIIGWQEAMSPHIYASFSILHELGHWYDYQDRYVAAGLGGAKYLSDYSEEQSKLRLNELIELTRKQIKGSQAHIQYLALFHKRYREHPFEQIADQFAICKLRELIK
ncbi:hypothetical protein DFP93_105221 [Aneurinibacillus soli]|uniref:Uncharacterized protein n=1 Tax=Aneurinibacillus soli TaxID=1500254 RepID=A0A0U5C8B7_9BACL|nr:hypothetical protein [Aneurinibacillus soli]PYE62264.1 hypothetical protein DFP93_105221 [Aneurinibacillus soli]BAU28547.1 hypothetical protein CB4_02722 [Aneurinibacillus soli]